MDNNCHIPDLVQAFSNVNYMLIIFIFFKLIQFIDNFQHNKYNNDNLLPCMIEPQLENCLLHI